MLSMVSECGSYVQPMSQGGHVPMGPGNGVSVGVGVQVGLLAGSRWTSWWIVEVTREQGFE